ncbi:MAG: hypothetical protein H7221_06505, partial [Flavobacterium sp.]|nr:hypothetical protein [Flavobacterium sp.]
TILKVNSGGCDRALSPNTTSVLVGAKSTYSAVTGWDFSPVTGREIIFDADYNIAANLSGCSCTVNPGKVVTIPSGSSMILLNSIAVDTTNPITSLTFENTAPLIQINNVANSGKISVKRNSSQLMRLDYTLWSSPVAGQNLLAFSPATYNVAPSNIRFYTYNTTSNFYSIIPPASNSFAFGLGYLIRMPDNHPTTPTIWPGQFTGIPNNGNTSVPISYISNTQAFNSIGNPYPSPINLYDITNGFMKVNAANIESTIYFWRKTNSNTANSGYCSYNNNILVSATNSTFNGTNPNGVIQTGQGFLITAKPGATSVLFNNDMRIASTVNQFNKTVEADHNTIWLNLTNDINSFAQTAVTYRPNGTNNIDDYDGVNLNDGQISVGSSANNKNYIIQSRLFPFNETDVVPLIVKTNTSGNYTFAIDHLSGFFINRTQPIYLKDKLFNVLTDLNNGNYTFTATSGTDSNRFEIVYQNILSLPANTASGNAVVVYKNNTDFVINAGNAAISNVKIYDLQGRLLLSKVNINNSEVRLNIGNVNQMVIIKTTLIDGQVFSTKALN